MHRPALSAGRWARRRRHPGSPFAAFDGPVGLETCPCTTLDYRGSRELTIPVANPPILSSPKSR